MSREDPDQVNREYAELEHSLRELENSLISLKQRYVQIKQDKQRRSELLKNQHDLEQQPNLFDKSQLKQIQQELETIEFNLESSLFTWKSLKEPFWQALRFGGLGIVIGWILKSCAG